MAHERRGREGPVSVLTRDANWFAHRDLDEQADLLATVDLPKAARLLDALESAHQARLLDRLDDARVAELLRALPPDDRARLISAAAAEPRLLRLLAPEELAETQPLLRFPEQSVGRLMTPRYLALEPATPAGEAIELVRACAPEVDTVYSLPVTDGPMLLGMADLRALLISPPDRSAAEVMSREIPRLHPHEDQEVAARAVLDAQVLAAPVVDEGGRLLGLVTVDDAMEVLELEGAEDILRSGGAEPLGQPYLSTSLLWLARRRAVWLLVLALAATLTVNVLQVFESEVEEVVALALFIPLLIGTGGNAGAQATTTVVRALAVGDVTFRDLPRTVWREARVGTLLGGLLAALALGPVAVLYEARLALVVALTLLTICTLATVVGSALPVLVDRLGFDPAVVSAPFITTVVDATGLIVYFLIARAVFGL